MWSPMSPSRTFSMRPVSRTARKRRKIARPVPNPGMCAVRKLLVQRMESGGRGILYPTGTAFFYGLGSIRGACRRISPYGGACAGTSLGTARPADAGASWGRRRPGNACVPPAWTIGPCTPLRPASFCGQDARVPRTPFSKAQGRPSAKSDIEARALFVTAFTPSRGFRGHAAGSTSGNAGVPPAFSSTGALPLCGQDARVPRTPRAFVASSRCFAVPVRAGHRRSQGRPRGACLAKIPKARMSPNLSMSGGTRYPSGPPSVCPGSRAAGQPGSWTAGWAEGRAGRRADGRTAGRSPRQGREQAP